MSNKLSTWASIGEILSSLAVVVTLIVLIQGVEENNAVTRANAVERSFDSLNEWRMAVSQDEQVVRVLRAFNEGRSNELTDAEEYRMFLMLLSLWGIFEKSYYAWQYETLCPDEWNRYEYAICDQREQFDAELWGGIERWLTPRFRTYVVTLCG